MNAELQQIIDYADSIGILSYTDGHEHHFIAYSQDQTLTIITMALSIPFCHVASEYYNFEEHFPPSYLIKIDHAIGK